MTTVVNLRTARKRAAREADRKVATENAARHGVSRAERRLVEIETTRAVAHLDGHRRDPAE